MQSRAFLYLIILTTIFFIDGREASAQTWYPLGPSSTPSVINQKDYSLKFANGIGRVAKVSTMPGKLKSGQTPTLFLGTPYGGLWRLENGDTIWQQENSAQLMHIGIADMVVNPKNKQVRYIATGDPDCIMDPNGHYLNNYYLDRLPEQPWPHDQDRCMDSRQLASDLDLNH